MPRLRLHQLVASEFEEGLAWYADLSPLAAENFTACFYLALAKMEKHPNAQASWRPPFRRIRLPRFPYLLIFHTDQRMTSVLALVHERREPRRTLATLIQRRKQF
ncbi:MAG: hypothetical protein ABI273_02325 [Lacunisphaera sp.]